jgi:1,2-diacylglycerol 3-beta-galactosyltransferase
VGLVEALSRLNWRYLRPALEPFLARHPADAIVSFYPMMNHVLIRALRTARLTTPVVSVVVDMVTVHASWFLPGAQSYVVPTSEARQAALRHGVPPERISVAGGMPVRRAFVEARGTSQAEARASLGVSPEGPLVLVVGGGEGMGPLEAVVRALVAHLPKTQVVAVAGHNRSLYERLVSLSGAPNLRVEGFVTDMERWMRAADVMVTKAGPNLLCEAFLCALPVVLYAAVPGQEEGNVTYVVEHGAGMWAPRPRKVVEAVAVLLADPERRREMAARSAALAVPEAAERIARHVWDVGESAAREPTLHG